MCKTVVAVMLILGIGIAWHGASGIFEASEKRKWPIVEGTVIRSEVLGNRAFHPNVVYTYEVKGTQFVDSTDFDPASFGGRNSKKNTASVIASQNGVGARVSVYYDPAAPTRSTLRPFAHWSSYGMLAFGSSLVIAGVCLTWVSIGLRKTRRTPITIA